MTDKQKIDFIIKLARQKESKLNDKEEQDSVIEALAEETNMSKEEIKQKIKLKSEADKLQKSINVSLYPMISFCLFLFYITYDTGKLSLLLILLIIWVFYSFLMEDNIKKLIKLRKEIKNFQL